MDVTTMARTNLLARLRADYPAIIFQNAHDFYWSPRLATVFYANIRTQAHKKTLLHETAHAILGHTTYQRDIELLKIEREAWQFAQSTLGPTYGVAITDDTIETALDSYRDWLHHRSTCPSCTMNGVQIQANHYRCVGCNHNWRVNDARRCGLRRHLYKKPS